MPPVRRGASRRTVFLIILFSVLLALIFVSSFRSEWKGDSRYVPADPIGQFAEQEQLDLNGGVIAPRLGNETAKAELGRAAWKYFHTVMARFPDEPTADEKLALKTYVHLFQRLYPCGECAEHFGLLINKFPPQVSSRSAAAAWACHVHNEVNRSLEKELFDCSKIGDFYDCGCAEDEDVGGQSSEIRSGLDT